MSTKHWRGRKCQHFHMQGLVTFYSEWLSVKSAQWRGFTPTLKALWIAIHTCISSTTCWTLYNWVKIPCSSMWKKAYWLTNLVSCPAFCLFSWSLFCGYVECAQVLFLAHCSDSSWVHDCFCSFHLCTYLVFLVLKLESTRLKCVSLELWRPAVPLSS